MWRRNECQSQMIQNPVEGNVCGIRQKDLFIEKDRGYQFAVVVKVNRPVNVRVALSDGFLARGFTRKPSLVARPADGEGGKDGGWRRFETVLTPAASDGARRAEHYLHRADPAFDRRGFHDGR